MPFFARKRDEQQPQPARLRDPEDMFKVPHTFWMPCDQGEVAQALRDYGISKDGQLGRLSHMIDDYFESYGNAMGVLATAPIAGGIYVESITPEQIRVRAGNRVQEFWRVDVSLANDGQGGCNGTVVMINDKAPGQHVTQWYMNVMDPFLAIMGASRQAGGRLIEWPMDQR